MVNHSSILLLAVASGFLVVALGAFGAHGLAEVLGPRVSNWNTAVQYQMFHTSVLLVIGLMMSLQTGGISWLWGSAVSFLLGILLFSGSLYVLGVTGITWLGMITPLGGVAFLAGWVLLAMAVFKAGNQRLPE